MSWICLPSNLLMNSHTAVWMKPLYTVNTTLCHTWTEKFIQSATLTLHWILPTPDPWSLGLKKRTSTKWNGFKQKQLGCSLQPHVFACLLYACQSKRDTWQLPTSAHCSAGLFWATVTVLTGQSQTSHIKHLCKPILRCWLQSQLWLKHWLWPASTCIPKISQQLLMAADNSHKHSSQWVFMVLKVNLHGAP